MTTRVDEVADGIFRISTPVPATPQFSGFSFNQYLVVDDDPLLFHTGSRRLFAAVRDAIARVMPVERLRWISFSHHEQDEDGALNELLAIAPRAQPACGAIGAMINADGMDRAPRVLADRETLALGRRVVRWIDTPHVPHGWESGLLFEETTRTLFCGDVLSQPGTGDVAVTEDDVLGASEAMRRGLDYWSHGPHVATTLAKLATLAPRLLACMHGSAWRGDGARVLNELAKTIGPAR